MNKPEFTPVDLGTIYLALQVCWEKYSNNGDKESFQVADACVEILNKMDGAKK